MTGRRHRSSSWPGRRPGCGGFTIIELMVAVAVLAVLLAIAVPNFNDASLSARLNGFANSLVAAAQVARSEAIKRNSDITLCASSNGTSCAAAGSGGWEQGWIVLSGGTVLQRQQALPEQFKVNQAGLLVPSPLTFPGTVVGATTATLTVCRFDPVGSEERVVTVNGTGAAYVTITNTGTCS